MDHDHSDVLKALSARIQTLRRTRGLTQRELAEHAGLSEGTVTRLEKNHEPPTLSSLLRLASALDVALPDLFTTSPKKSPRPTSALPPTSRRLVEILPRLDAAAQRQLLVLARLLAKRR